MKKGVVLIIFGVILFLLAGVGAIVAVAGPLMMSESQTLEAPATGNTVSATFKDLDGGTLSISSGTFNTGSVTVTVTGAKQGTLKTETGVLIDFDVSIDKKDDYTVTVTGLTGTDYIRASYNGKYIAVACYGGCCGFIGGVVIGIILIIVGIVLMITGRPKKPAPTPPAQFGTGSQGPPPQYGQPYQPPRPQTLGSPANQNPYAYPGSPPYGQPSRPPQYGTAQPMNQSPPPRQPGY